MPVLANPTNYYRILVSTFGNRFQAELSQESVPIGSLSAVDSTYRSGVSGVFAFSNTDAGAVDARFDFYQAAVPEPSTYLLLAFGFAGFGLVHLHRHHKRNRKRNG
jgi:hypothetical protein